jgi:RHS repeat-associated protein
VTCSTGKERDAETGLDYFGARYLSSAQGRFTSPDAPFADQHPEDPQSWNMYAYARNNPLQFVDPDGKEIRLAAGADVNNLIRVLSSAYMKADFRPMFNQLSSSNNTFVITNADIDQSEHRGTMTVTEGYNVPQPTDPSRPISNTNLTDTIRLTTIAY